MTNNPFTLTFTLRQHTPLIHFHEHEGATLRSTELKPKLDEFIMKELLREVGEHPQPHLIRSIFLKNATQQYLDKEKNQANPNYNTQWKNWLVGKGEAEHVSLDYKIAVHPQSVKQSEIPNKFPCFFANIGTVNRENPKRFSNVNGDFDFQLTSNNLALNKKLSSGKWVEKFFAVTNFGTRQSKGFGSFYCWKKGAVASPIEAILPSGTNYLELNSTEDQKIFTIIDFYSKRLKSGINYSKFNSRTNRCEGPYHKSYLFQFLANEDLGYSWEKRAMKEFFFGLAPAAGKEPRFVRAFLGLPGSVTFRKTKETCNKGNKVKVEDEVEIEISDPTKDVSRIKSPITFKPIKTDTGHTRIYILTSEYAEKQLSILQGRAFKFLPKFKLFYLEENRYTKELKRRSKLVSCEYRNYADLVEAAKRLEEDDASFIGQAERFEKWMANTRARQLPIPSVSFNIADLTDRFNAHLGATFNAETFDQANIEASIGKTEQSSIQ